MFNKNKEIPVDSAAGNRIGTVFSLGSWHGKELPSDSTHPYNAVYHAKGISNTPFGRVSLGWHATVESAQAALRDHHEGQKQRYQRAADLHRRDADHHQGIRDSMQDSYVPRSKLAIIKEAIAETTMTNAQAAAHYDGEVAYLKQFRSKATEKAKWYRGATQEDNENAYREHVRQTQAKADKFRAAAAAEKTEESYVSERAIRFRVVAKNHSLDGRTHGTAQAALKMARGIKRTGGKAHVEEISTGHVVAESKKEDEETSAEIKPWHWTGAKTALANKYPGTFNPKMSTRHPKFPNVIKVNGKSLSLKRMIAYVAGKMAERDAAKAKK